MVAQVGEQRVLGPEGCGFMSIRSRAYLPLTIAPIKLLISISVQENSKWLSKFECSTSASLPSSRSVAPGGKYDRGGGAGQRQHIIQEFQLKSKL